MRRCEGRRRALGALLLLVAAAAPAAANTRSQQLLAKALVSVHAQRWAEAKTILDQAAAADPEDPEVLYYRGLSEARLNDPNHAIADLEHALSLRPDMQQAVLDLGILYFQTDQYQRAEQWLKRAYQQPSTRFSAAFFLGMTRLRLGDAKGAVPLFVEAAKDPALRTTAQYYQGVALLRTGDQRGARQLFGQVQSGPPDAETTQLARQYVTAPAPIAAPGAVKPVEKPWTVYAEGGFGYDSNVRLLPNDVTLPATTTVPARSIIDCYTGSPSAGTCKNLETAGDTDGFFAVAFGGAYRLFATDLGQGSIGYDFYNSAHFQSAQFDLQDHELHLDLSTTLQEFAQFGLSGIYDYYLLDYRSFYQQGRVVPWMTFFEGDVTATQVYYQFTGQDYAHGSPNDPGPFSPFRDALNNAFGARQYFLLGAADRYLSVGYQWDNNDPLSRDGTDFTYTDNIFEVRGDFNVLDWFRATVGYAFDCQDYEHPNSRTDFGKRRHDGQNQVVIRAARDITSYLSADLSYFGLFNSSNIPDFEYDRNIVQAAVRVHF